MKINSVNTVSLGEVLEYEQPTKYIVDNTNYDDEFDIPVLTAGKSFLLGYTNETHNVFSNVPVIIFDDFTTAFKYVDFPFKVKSSAMKILKANKEIADIRFLYYRMMKTGIDTELHKRYWISKYSKVKIPLPPLDQQKKIAAILDAADAYRQKTKALITKYEELTQSLFLDMFGDPSQNPHNWELKNCGEFIEYLADIGSNGANKTVSKNLVMSDSEDYAVMIRTTNLSRNNFKSNLKFVSKEVYDFFKKSQVFGGEIIMNKIGSAGDFWIMPKLDRPVSLGLNQFVIRLKGINLLYFYYFLSTDYGYQNIKARCNGVATKSITKTAVRELPILHPPLELQNKFAERVQAIEAQKNQAQASLAQAEDLFNSLLQRAFKGELTA